MGDGDGREVLARVRFIDIAVAACGKRLVVRQKRLQQARSRFPQPFMKPVMEPDYIEGIKTISECVIAVAAERSLMALNPLVFD